MKYRELFGPRSVQHKPFKYIKGTQGTMILKNRYIPYLLFFLIAIIAFWQLVFFKRPPVYDMVDCFYPWRFHIGECLRNGIFPFWDPYQDLGYPEFANPSSGVWYPMVWLIGSTVGYNLYTISLEFVVHVFFAGVGMYLLAQTLKMARPIAVIAAVSYMLCGVFIGNAQHLPYVIGAAWLPFVLHFYFRMIYRPFWSNAIYAGFFLFLMITGGYPAMVIILFYFFAFTSLFYLIRSIKDRQRFVFSDLLFRHAALVLTTLVFSAGMMVSIWQVSPYLSRIDGGFTLEQALFSPFGPKAFISFILPYSTTHFPETFNGDISMINGYFGFLLFILLFAGLFTKKSIELKILLILGIVSLTAAVGDALPVRKLLFDYVPMMNVFRFPAVFRTFVILPFILIGANYLNNLYKEERFLSLRKWWIPLTLIALSLIGFLFFLRSQSYLDLKHFMAISVFGNDRTGSIEQHMAFQTLIQLGFVLLLFLVIRFVKQFKYQFLILIGLISADMLISAHLNAPYTVYNSSISVAPSYNATDTLPKGFPPMKDITIEEGGKLPGLGQPYWQNLNIFHKQVTAEGFNSFSFSSYDGLETIYPFIFHEMQKNHLVLLTDQIRHEASMRKADRDSLYKPNQLYFSDDDFGVIRMVRMKHSPGDTAYLVDYDANHFSIRANTKDIQLLTLFQKEFRGWKAYVNGEETPIYKSNRNFMTIVLPSGVSKVEFRYINYPALIGFGLSLLACLWLLIYLIYKWRFPEIHLHLPKIRRS